MTTRRTFLAALLVAATPLRAFAQARGKLWRIGFLVPRSRSVTVEGDDYAAFVRGMRELGHVEGKSFIIEWRFADGKVEVLPELAAQLVKLNVDVIVTSSTHAILAAQKATATIPIVMANSSDPVGSGFVKSLAKPGGNITGLSSLGPEIIPKHLEMLLSIVPRLSYVAVLVGPDNPSTTAGVMVSNLRAAALKSGVRLLSVEARTFQEIERAFDTMAREKVAAVIVAVHPFFTEHAHQIAEFAARHRLPSIYPWRQYPEAGGLMSYGQNLQDHFRQAAIYVDKILKGAKPGDLPVAQSIKFELVINRATARTLGLSIPQELLLRADKVIE